MAQTRPAVRFGETNSRARISALGRNHLFIQPKLKTIPRLGELFSSAAVNFSKSWINAFVPTHTYPMLCAGTTDTPTLNKHVRRASVSVVPE